MISTFLVFTPVLVLMVWLVIFSIRRRDWPTVVCVPMIVSAVIYQFIVLSLQWFNNSQHMDLVKINYWVSDSIFVFVYIYMSEKCNRAWYRIPTWVLVAMMFINLNSGITLYLGDEWATPPPADGRLYIFLHGESIFRIKLWQTCMAMQFIWIAGRFSIYMKRLEKQHLHIDRRTTTLITVIGATMSAGFISLFLPDKMWYGSIIPLSIVLILVSTGLCASIYLIYKGYGMTPILDANDEPAAYASYEDRESIWERVQRAVIDNDLYLQPDVHIAEVALLAGTNRTYVTNAISQNTDTNFNGYINRLRVEHATELMAEYPEKKLEEIATMCGFSSASSFTKIYKKETGWTPKEGKKKRIRELQRKKRRADK